MWGVVVAGPQGQRADLPEPAFSAFLLHYAGVYDEEAVFLFDHERWSGPPVFRALGD